MLRIIFFMGFVLALGFGFAWVADRPGEVLINWQGQQIEMSIMVGVAGLVGLIALIMFSWWLIRNILFSPQMVAGFFKSRKRDRGYEALSAGLIAAGAGNVENARKLVKKSHTLLNVEDEPLIRLLEAQTALLDSDHEAARVHFEAMLQNDDTKELGLRGLYMEAKRLGSNEAAKHFAEEATALSPQLSWAGQATLEYHTIAGDWDAALLYLKRQKIARGITNEKADRTEAILLTAKAIALSDSDPVGASSAALIATRLAPELLPAATTAARALLRQNKLSKAVRVLEKIWKLKPHPEVANIYIHARVGDSHSDHLKRARKLESLVRNNVESLFCVAQAALGANDYVLARKKAEEAARLGAREGIYLLLADIEEAETADQGRVRYWLAQALRASRDPAWIAEGIVREHWAPIGPSTGRLDAFEWKTPHENAANILENRDAHSQKAEKIIATLPPLQVADPVEQTSNEAENNIETIELLSKEAAPILADIPPVKDEAETLEPVTTTEAVKVDAAAAAIESSNEEKEVKVEAATESDEVEINEPNDGDVIEEVEAAPSFVEEEALKKEVVLSENIDKKNVEKIPENQSEKAAEEHDFFTQRPDDPGVRQEYLSGKKTNRFRLF